MRRAAVGALAWAVLLAAPAFAHLQSPTLKAERRIELLLNERPIGLKYRIAFGPELAIVERRQADRDRDRVVSSAEGSAALDARSAQLLRALRVCTGRALDDLECRELRPKQIELVEAEGWTPDPAGHLHLAWSFDLGDAVDNLGAVRIEDGWEVPGVEMTEVRIEPPKTRVLVAAGEGSAPQGVARAFTWIEARRGPGPRLVSAAWPAPERRWVTVAVVSALIALGAALYWRTRRERRMAIG